MVAKSLPRKQVRIKNFHQNFLVENFYGCKIITSKIGLNRTFSLNFYGRKLLMVAKSLPRKQFGNKNFYQDFRSEIFYA